MGVSVIAHGPEVAPQAAELAAALADTLPGGCARLELTALGEGGGLDADHSGGLDVDAPAFIMTTSGSSGTPKLVVRSQRGLAYYGAVRALDSRAEDRVIGSLGPPGSFSGSIRLLEALFAGCTVYYSDIRRDGVRSFLQLLAAERITMLFCGASLLRTLAALPGAREALSQVRMVRFSGEPTAPADVALLRPLLPAGCRFDNVYGATEALGLVWTVPPEGADAMADGAPHLPAGFVLSGVEAAIFDAAGQLCAPGQAGELVLRSRYNAQGEWVDGRCVPGRLIPDPTAPGARVYFTGDLARAGDDGCVVVLGRIDRMLKINGQRVEPMEVESAIREVADVVDVAVLPRVRGQVTQLIAFVVPGPRGQGEIAGALRDRLRRHLPAHMLPARIVAVDTLPRLASGKVDGVALLAGLDRPDQV